MGSLLLSCPFCCEEKFSTHSSLKYHILSIIENLLCPACSKRFDNILELVDHLGKECKDDYKKELENDSQEAEPNLQPKLEQMDDDEAEELENVIPNEDAENATESTSYICQICNVSFTSIQEHLEKFHEGEEVVVETEDGEVKEDEGEGSMIYIQSFEEEEEYEAFEGQPETTVEEETRVDKDGRAYTRKVVKIDKFWMPDGSPSPAEPMTEKYFVDNGKIKKVSLEEAEEIAQSNKSALIEIHQCPACYLQFPNMDLYQNHVCDLMKSKTKFKCSHCTAVFANYKSLTAHMETHVVRDPTGEVKKTIILGPFLCEVCKTMFPSYKSLKLHKRMHEPVKDKEIESPVSYSITGNSEEQTHLRHMFVCNICNKTYDKEYEEIHLKSHSNDDNFDCEVCNRKFYTKENLDMHMKAHNNCKKFICSYCKKPFLTFEALNEHVNNQCQKRQYECQFCGRRFARPHEKVKHERIHTGEKPHVCQICGKAFRVSYCLTLHMRTHSGTRPYQCHHCPKRFKSHSVYNHHLLTHSDVRNYKCPYCPKAFKTSVQLAGHKNSHIKPFSCTECNRPFASLYAVRAHMETHKRENNLKYDCWLCGASYARLFALKDHMRAQHETTTSVLGDDENMLVDLDQAVATDNIEGELEQEIEEDDGEVEEEMAQVEEAVGEQVEAS